MIAIAVAVLIAVVGGLLYVDARGDAQSTSADLEEAQARADDLNGLLDDSRNELSTTNDDLDETRKQLRERTQQFNLTSKCLIQLFGAWYNTTRLSYSATGVALGIAVNSRRCRIPRAAYERTA